MILLGLILILFDASVRPLWKAVEVIRWLVWRLPNLVEIDFAYENLLEPSVLLKT